MSIGCTHINSCVNILYMIELQLPYPPSVNHYWGQRGNHRFVGKKGQEFRLEVKVVALERKIKAIEGRLSLKVYLYPPDKRKRDIDNVLKSLLDAMEHAGVYENDSQLDELYIKRCEVVKGGKCVVVITQLPLSSSEQ